MRAKLKEGVVFDVVGDKVLILDSPNQLLHCLPLSYLGTIEALSTQGRISDLSQLAELENLGFAVVDHSATVSRRAVVFGAGAAGASLVMPTVAFASSENLVIDDDAFVWTNSGANLAVNSGLLDSNIFIVGSPWTLTLFYEDSSRDSMPVDALKVGSDTLLTFVFSNLNLNSNTDVRGRLSGPQGLTSNVFRLRFSTPPSGAD